MARTNDLHFATLQFFINVVDNHFLNFRSKRRNRRGYCIFVEVTDSINMVDKIKGIATGRCGMHQDVPKDDVIIIHVTIAE